MKGYAIDENHCSFQLSLFDVRNYYSVLATPMKIKIQVLSLSSDDKFQRESEIRLGVKLS